MSLQVTSQSALEYGDANSMSDDAFGTIKAVSVLNNDNYTNADLETLPGPIERDVMQFSNTTIPVLCRKYIKYTMLNLVRRAQSGQPKLKSHNNGNLSSPWILLILCILCFVQS